ncbi:hypothetical protein CK203_046880 [Vitis vinifera]|uniref:Uncharacterized protein n=1 Tax=Vitis vinifera TaxID=29760 RepID=A0A438HY94_VITVI|nr:hypothetical protein CK203_046880 [Vitis vinifera]
MSTSSLEQAILKISKVMEDFVGEQQKINSHLNEKIDNLESSINVRMEGVYNDLSLRIEKVQDSIEKLTNLDIARGKRKLPPQPTITFKEPMQKDQGKFKMTKRLLEPFKASTSPGKRRETNSLGPNGKDANFVWDPGGIQHEVGMMLAKIEFMVKTKENRGEKPKQSNSHHPISATVGNISITSRSLFHAYYISFQSLGSQEFIASNGARFGVETKKLWPFEDDCAKLNGNVATAPHFATVGHVFGALSGAQIMHTISLLKLRKSGVQCFKRCAIWI